jgi:hypothetical protein
MGSRAITLFLLTGLALSPGCGDDQPTEPRQATSTLLISSLNGSENADIRVDGTRIAAVGFTMPARGYTLASVRLKLRLKAGDAQFFVVRLFGNDAGNEPGTGLLTFANPKVPRETGSPEILTFDVPSPFSLQAGATYWVVVHYTGTGVPGWTCGNPSITPTGVATHIGAKLELTGAPDPPTTDTASIGEYAVVRTPE